MTANYKTIDNQISLFLLSDKEDTLIEIEDAMSSNFSRIYQVDIKNSKFHHILSATHKKVVFVYACETVKKAKELCDLVHNTDELVDLFLLPNTDFLLCPVRESKFAYDACIQDYFQDYSTMHPIYDKWNLILRFINIIDTNSIVRSKSNIEMRYKKLKLNAQDLIAKLKHRPNNFNNISANMNTAISEAASKINQGIKSIPGDISNGDAKAFINITNAEKADDFFNEKADSIEASSLTGLQDLTQSINDIQKKESKSDVFELDVNASKKSHSIFLIDDEPFMQRVISPILAKSGYKLSYLDEGKKLFEWEKHVELAPDVILLDIDMPEENGLQVLKRIKSEGLFAGIPIIMLSGHDDKRVMRKASDLGSSGYIVKPVKSEILLTILSQLTS